MTKKIYLLTKNPYKIQSAKKVFDQYNIDLVILDQEYDEIQANTSLEVARDQAIKAAKENNVAVLREDHSLFLDAIGIPGPYTNYIEKRIPAETLIKLLGDNKKGYFEIATVYAEPNGDTKEFVFTIPITVADTPRGERGNRDRILMMEGSNKTFAECEEGENLHHRQTNFLALAKELIRE